MRTAVCGAVLALSLAGCAAPPRATQPLHGPQPSQLTQPATSPAAKQAVLLTGVSCTATGCAAVGWYYTSAAGPRRPLAERWTGRGWQVQRTAGNGVLAGVSCAAHTCLAIGQPSQLRVGGRWRQAAGTGLSSVSCVSLAWCQAVGGRSAARWTGQRWQPERVPVPAHRIVTLASVSCTSSRFCLAVGDAQRPPGARPSPGHTDQAVAERWDGARWRLIRPPDPAPRTALAGVSCTPRFCLAVGATSTQYALAERWTRAGWQVLRARDVNQIGYTVLTTVSCAATCVAAGTYNGSRLVVERWDGHRWRLARYGPVTGPPSVSCAAACLVVAPGPRWLRLRA